MDKKKSFLIFAPEFLAITARMTDKQRGELITAVCEFVMFDKAVAPISDGVKDAYEYLKETISQNLAKYKEICEKRRISGSMGGKMTQANDKQMLQSAYDTEKQKATYNENDNESDNVYLKEKEEKEKISPFRPTLDEVITYLL